MGFKRCPGSTALAQPKIELVECPHCGAEAEVWSDEAEARCDECGKTVVRLNRQSCADRCKYAKECLGETKYKKYQDTKSAIRKEALMRAAADRFGLDEKQVEAAQACLKRAEELSPVYGN